MSKEETDNQRATLTVAETQKVLGVGRNQVYALIKANDLAINVGRKLLVPRVRLEHFLEGK